MPAQPPAGLISVGVCLGVRVAVGVSVGLSVLVGVGVSVGLRVRVGIAVLVLVGVSVGRGVQVAVGVAMPEGQATAKDSGINTSPVWSLSRLIILVMSVSMGTPERT